MQGWVWFFNNLMFMKSMNDGIRGLMIKAGHAFDLIDTDQSKELSESSEI